MVFRFEDQLLEPSICALSGRVMVMYSQSRKRLNFPDKVRRFFSFLVDSGFSVVDSQPTLVLFRKGAVEVDVYHGRHSREVGVGVSAFGDRYSLSEVLRSGDPVRAEDYRSMMVATPDGLAAALSEASDILQRYGVRALNGEVEFFAELKRNRSSWSKNYALEVLAQQVRPKAESAFREGRYAEAVELYSRIRECLTPLEAKKLAIAETRRS